MFLRQISLDHNLKQDLLGLYLAQLTAQGQQKADPSVPDLKEQGWCTTADSPKCPGDSSKHNSRFQQRHPSGRLV